MVSWMAFTIFWLVFVYCQSDTEDHRPPVLVIPRRVLDRHVAVSKTAPARMHSAKERSFHSAPRFCRELLHVKRIDDAVHLNQEVRLFILAINPLPDGNKTYPGKT